jgi:hypothetical protein
VFPYVEQVGPPLYLTVKGGGAVQVPMPTAVHSKILGFFLPSTTFPGSGNTTVHERLFLYDLNGFHRLTLV